MTVTEKQKDLVKDTVPVLKENGVALTDYFYKRMLKNNPQLKETFNLGHQRSGAQARALAGAVLAYAENIDDPSVLGPVVELICNKHVSLSIQPDQYSIVGENLLHSISEVLKIPMDDELISAWAAAYQQLADLFIATEKKLYDQHEATKGSWLGWREFVVKKKVKESKEITSFYLTPKDGGALPIYKPGQYISVRVTVPRLGLKQPRQYSLSDSPHPDHLRISVKREDPRVDGQDPGYVSSTLHDHINEGDVIEVSAPCGNFFLLNPNTNNVLISAGVGLTPMVAMLNQLITDSETTGNINFIHAVRGSDVQAMRVELQKLAEEHKNVNLFFCYENVKDGDVKGRDYHLQGRLSLDKVPDSYLPNDADYYLCGPMSFMQSQHDALVKRGLPADKIHSEAFGTGGVAF